MLSSRPKLNGGIEFLQGQFFSFKIFEESATLGWSIIHMLGSGLDTSYPEDNY
jgi:hypothetical protein